MIDVDQLDLHGNDPLKANENHHKCTLLNHSFSIKKKCLIPFVNFSDFEDVEQEEQEIVPEEPEIRISREELIARYQVC
jgi:hypothetical protein